MKFRNFGDTNLKLSEVTFGPMRFAEKTPGDDGRSNNGIRALHAALDGGVTTIHSSGEYGTRWALQKALANHPKKREIEHIIKVQSPDYDDDAFNADYFTQQVETALRELETDRIAIVQHLQRGPRLPKEIVYNADGDPTRIAALTTVNGALSETFGKLQQQGKVGYLATFPHTVGFARAALDSGAFKGMVHFYDLLETEMVQFFDEFQQKGMGFIGIRPVMQGLLTDKRVNRNHLPEGDKFRDPNWDPWFELLDAIKAELKSMGENTSAWTAYAIKFCLAHPVVTTVVAGMNDQRQAEQIVAACDGDYPSGAVVDAVTRVTHGLPWIPKETVFG